MSDLANLTALNTTEPRQRRLYTGACIVLAAVMGYYFFEAKTSDFINRLQGLLILFLAVFPSIEWTKSNDKRFPLVEVLMLTTANSYAFPILSAHEEATGYPTQTISLAAWIVISFQIAVILSYRVTTGRAKSSPFWTDELMGSDACRYLSYGVVMDTIYLYLSDYTTIIPYNLDTICRAACFGISIVCTFITAQLWGAGKIRPSEKTFFVINLALQAILQTVTLFMVGVISTFLLAILGYVTSSKRLPLVVCAIGLFVVAVLHNGEPAMRMIYWSDDGTRLVPPIYTLPSFYSQWTANGLAPPSKSGDEDEQQGVTGKLLQRTSLFQMICLVSYASPDHLPFLDGETYSDIFAQFIPRQVWPDKPNGLQSTYKLSVYYGLQSEEATGNTTIAFGQVSEAYANYGFFGVIVLGIITGVCYKKIQVWASNSPIISFPGVLLVVLMAWSFQTEFTLSTWVSSLYQACVCIFALMLAVRSFAR